MKQYNQILINRDSLTFWINREGIQLWRQTKQSSHRGPRLFSTLAITIAFMLKHIFSIPLRSLQGFIHFILKLAQLLLLYPHYSCISKRTKTANVVLETKTKGTTQYLAINSTGLKITMKNNK
ncbi:Mobile element protein [Candidatus Enterovibrio altilux]|uniref:Mobile element protein n=1 Tax=Candidatus Enterovibrio altilux TaxID=1927128 RepID=A0A291B9Q2_9GAMM|nr:Mobile element protein [Candidatus Enterovibrio luxaltus]